MAQHGRRHFYIWPMRAVPAGLFLAILSCAGQSPQSWNDLDISGMRMENRSQSFVTAARLLVPATGNFVSCGGIAPGGVCATRFPETRFTGNPVEVSWSQNGQIWSTGQLRLVPAEEVVEAGAATVLVIITAPGGAGVSLLPYPHPPSS